MNIALILDFLKQLQTNNNREWFNEHKALFLEAKAEFEIITQNLINHLALEDHSIKTQKAKDCIFRIYRDVRFSKDKKPYKTHFGAYINQGGRKSETCGYYFHLEPEGTFLAGGVHDASSAILYEIRDAIYADTEDFKAIIEAPAFVNYFGTMQGDKLKRAPKGFPKEFEDIELLKHKRFLAIHHVDDNHVIQEDFLEKSLLVYKAMQPFNAFFNRAILMIE